MTAIQNILVSISLSVYLIIVLYEIKIASPKRIWNFFLQLCIIILIIYILHKFCGYFNSLEIKGGSKLSEGFLLTGLYLSTLLGILGNHIFIQIKGIKESGRKPKFKWLPIIKPIAVSPIIFLTVLTQLDKMGAQTTTLTSIITQFILAFQNGFFWKTLFDQDERKK